MLTSPGTADDPSCSPVIRDHVLAPMTSDHLPAVMGIDALCYPIPWPKKAYESELARTEDRLYLVARLQRSPAEAGAQGLDPPRIAGHGGVAFEADEAHITTLTVAPECRGQGVGARLLLALTLAARRHTTSLALEVAADNPAAQSLYRRFGLAPVGIQRGYYADMGTSPDAVVMRADNIHHPDYADRLVKIAVELDCQ